MGGEAGAPEKKEQAQPKTLGDRLRKKKAGLPIRQSLTTKVGGASLMGSGVCGQAREKKKKEKRSESGTILNVEILGIGLEGSKKLIEKRIVSRPSKKDKNHPLRKFAFERKDNTGKTGP